MAYHSLLLALFTISIILLITATARLLSILPPQRPKPHLRKRGTPTHLLIVLGSGGHTSEMLSMLEKASTSAPHNPKPLDWKSYTHRTWIVGQDDTFSALRTENFEASIAAKGTALGAWTVRAVPRARRIHQPLLTTPLSSLMCLYACICVLLQEERQHGLPDLILTNGPATATIMVLASVVVRFFNLRGAQSKGKMRTIYVESFARVKKLSLSGRIMCWLVDRVLVQWEQLHGVGGKGEYLGVLVG